LKRDGVYPILHCHQEIPCNPCTSVCPNGLIKIDEADIRGLPRFIERSGDKGCIGCEQCVAICPGLAVTLVDYRQDAETPLVTIAYEFLNQTIAQGDRVMAMDDEGAELGEMDVVQVKAIKRNDRTILVKVRAPADVAERIAGIRVQPPWVSKAMEDTITPIEDDAIICRCERVKAGEIRRLIRQGVRDVNEIKAVTRAGMGACGSKTCANLILRLFREEGVPLEDVTPNVKRPLFMEVPLGTFAGAKED